MTRRRLAGWIALEILLAGSLLVGAVGVVLVALEPGHELTAQDRADRAFVDEAMRGGGICPPGTRWESRRVPVYIGDGFGLVPDVVVPDGAEVSRCWPTEPDPPPTLPERPGVTRNDTPGWCTEPDRRLRPRVTGRDPVTGELVYNGVACRRDDEERT